MKLNGGRSLWALTALALFDIASCADEGWTTKHEKGRCAMKGQASSGFSTLPIADNDLADEPDDAFRKKLVDVCGEDWSEGPVCCTEEQVDTLKGNLGTANNILGSCAACKTNFYNLFCTFTCSPDQSVFVNVTKTKGSNHLVDEVDNLWSDAFGSGFWDSCKDVKVSGTNTRAVSLMASGATNYTQLLAGLGKKRPFIGSPFQINFPRPSEGFPGMGASNPEAYPCNSTNPNYRCACLDCESSCAEPPSIAETNQCYVGLLPCLSFAAILIYSIFIGLLVTAITGHVAYRKHAQSKSERMRLLQDTSLSDAEDEDDDVVYQAGSFNRSSRRYPLNSIIDALFTRLGRTCARYPAIVISTSVVLVALLSLGWLGFAIETDPVRLWVAPNSAAAQEKVFFDENFGPFFRAEQAFLVNDTSAGMVLSAETLHWWSGVENRVRSINTTENNIVLKDVCYAPTGDSCIVQSVLRYWDSANGFDPNDWEGQLEDCVEHPGDEECRPTFQQPISPKLVLGGYNGSVLTAEAMITTWVIKNSLPGHKQFDHAMEWESSLEQLLKSVQDEAKERGLRLSFNTEISLEEELNKSTNTDAKIVVISYIIMFIYASLALGSTTVAIRHTLRNPTSALVQSKFMLGVVGIVIVLLSVSASVGLFSAAGVKVTLIIAEVIPFLVLAVGVDNIFLIVHEFERVNASHPDTSVEERVGKALGRMGPSILLSAAMETVAFSLGAFVGMPAVRNFAAYAAGAVFINALLQVTMFISALALNQRRVEAQRVDCFPCARVKQASNTFAGAMPFAVAEEDSLQRFIRRTYAPALLGKKTKVAVATVFLGLFAAGIALLPSIQLGLDQRIALPSDSYLIDYFNDLAMYFDTGPPVYFVARNVDATERKHQKQLCGRFPGCDVLSLANLLEAEQKRSEVSYISDSPASWVDDFFLWLDPQYEGCCTDSQTGRPCFEVRDPGFNKTLSGMPEGIEYIHYLKAWLSDVPSQACVYGGKAQFSDAIVYEPSTSGPALSFHSEDTKPRILASHFRTSHTPLRTQDDFISAYASARRISREISDANDGIDVFPYSKFYIFFDQYATIVPVTLRLLGAGVVVCFLISAVLLGSIRTALVVSITVIMILVDIAGAMAVANVSLNAVTLVNLVICVGIAVEFCAHIARAFQFPSARLLDRSAYAYPGAGGSSKITIAARGSADAGASSVTSSAASVLRGRDARAYAALVQVGGSVFSGITITKLLGVCVLAFTRSKIFEIYYFRVWLALVIFAALHALIFLPVALSWFGGPDGYIDPLADGGLEEDLARRRGLGGGVGRGRGRPYMDDYEDEEDDEEHEQYFDEDR